MSRETGVLRAWCVDIVVAYDFVIPAGERAGSSWGRLHRDRLGGSQALRVRCSRRDPRGGGGVLSLTDQ